MKTLLCGTYIPGRGRAAGWLNYVALGGAIFLAIIHPAFLPFLLPAVLIFAPANRRWFMRGPKGR